MEIIGTEFIVLSMTLFSIFEVYIMFKYLINKKHGRLAENIIVYIVIVLFLYLKIMLQLQIFNFITVFLIITVFGHTYIGEYCNVYRKSKNYDRFLHLFGSFTFSLFSYSIIENIFRPISYSKGYVAIFVATLGMSIGVIFELVEFTLDSIGKKDKYQKSQHGLLDTDFDLIFNAIGAVLAGFVSMKLF